MLTDDNELESIKIMQSATEQVFIIKEKTIHWELCAQNIVQLEIYRRITLTPACCTFKFLLQRQLNVLASTTEERKAFYHDSGDKN